MDYQTIFGILICFYRIFLIFSTFAGLYDVSKYLKGACRSEQMVHLRDARLHFCQRKEVVWSFSFDKNRASHFKSVLFAQDVHLSGTWIHPCTPKKDKKMFVCLFISCSRHRTTNFPNSEFFFFFFFFWFFCETHFFWDGAADCWSYFWSSKK